VTDKTFLLIDDEPHITSLVSFKLKQLGVNVITGVDGEQGFKLACQHLPDLIITDVQMPVLDGYEMSVKLRNTEQTREIPVIMLTARGHKLSPQELACTNIQYLVAKPFSARQLIDKARQAVHNTLQQFPPDEAEGKAA